MPKDTGYKGITPEAILEAILSVKADSLFVNLLPVLDVIDAKLDAGFTMATVARGLGIDPRAFRSALKRARTLRDNQSGARKRGRRGKTAEGGQSPAILEQGRPTKRPKKQKQGTRTDKRNPDSGEGEIPATIQRRKPRWVPPVPLDDKANQETVEVSLKAVRKKMEEMDIDKYFRLSE